MRVEDAFVNELDLQGLGFGARIRPRRPVVGPLGLQRHGPL